MRVLTTVPQDDLRKVPEAVRKAEADGFDGITTLENRNEPFLPLAVAAVASEKLSLETGIAIAFARSPMVVANLCWDLQVASRGRMILGLGSQIRPHNEKRFSVPWSAPAPRLREYVNALRAIWTAWEKGTRLRFEGKHYTFTLMTPNFVPASLGLPMVPVTLAAVGPHMLRLAGEVADGVRLHPLCSRLYLEQEVLPRIAEGAARTGRDPNHIELIGGSFVATGPDEESVAKLFEWVRMRIGFYGSTPAYWPVLDMHGLGDLGRKLNALSKEGKWTEMTAAVPDDVVNLFTCVGTHKEIAGVIAKRLGGISDALNGSTNTAVPSDLPPDVIQDIRRIPTRFKGYRTPW